jgi:CHC2 zinc finger
VVAFESFDPLKAIPPVVYVEALTGEEVPRNGYLRCPLPDHEDRSPSFQVLSSHWRCFGCNRGGGIIDLAAAVHCIEPRGRGYWELRDLIVDAVEGMGVK